MFGASLLASPLLKPALISLVLLLTVGAAVGYHAWTVRGLERDVAAAERRAEQEYSQRLKAQGNSEQLQAALDRQNAELTALLERAETAEHERARTLEQQRRRHAEARRRIETDDGHGPGVMNAWFAEQF